MTSDSSPRSRTPSPKQPGRGARLPSHKPPLAIFTELPAFADVLRESLEREGYLVFATGDLDAFAAHLRRHATSVAVVNLAASGRGGETIAFLRKEPALRQVRVLQVGVGLESPSLADAHLTVPFHLDELLAALDQLSKS